MDRLNKYSAPVVCSLSKRLLSFSARRKRMQESSVMHMAVNTHSALNI